MIGFLISILYIVLAGLIIAIVLFLIKPFRIQYITPYILKNLRNVLPPISATEQEAIDAGDIWWEAELFQGRPDWNKLLSLPKPNLTSEELDFVHHKVDELCSMLDEWTITHRDFDLPKKAWEYIKGEGFFGLIIPKEYGGLGFSALASSTIVQKISTRSLTAAVTTMVPNSLGPAELLIAYGTEEQKSYYLPKLAKGIEVPCFALTNPEAGSDAGAIPDFGIVCKGEYQGKEVIGMRLTWDKRYITLAPIATVLGLAFKLYDPDGLLGTKKELGITLCLLPTNHPGVEIGKRHLALNQPFMNGPTRGKDVFVPLDWIIGGPSMAGRGWRMLVECLSAGRGISLPALSATVAKHCYRTTGAYAKIRKQFKTSIGRFEGVEASLARIAGYTYLIEATRLLTLTGIDQHLKPAVATAIAKYHMTELARVIANDSMDIHGGKGIMMGPKNYIGRGYQSIPISITVEGANILTRNMIIFGQGAIRCHPYLRHEMNILTEKDESKAIADLDKTLMAHIGYSLSNMGRLIFHTLTGGFFISVPNGAQRRYVQQLSRMSLALAVVSDIAFLCLGGKLKRRERLSARLGDILSYLYIGSAVVKYYHDFGDKKHDPDYAAWALQTCLYRIQTAFLDFFSNFHLYGLAFILKLMIFPLGGRFGLPSDTLEHHLVKPMLAPSVFRDRLTQHTYLGNTDNAVSQLEYTLECMMAAEPAMEKLEAAEKKGIVSKKLGLDEKIRLAVLENVLTQKEVESLLTFEAERVKAIQVDEFSEEELVGKKGAKD